MDQYFMDLYRTRLYLLLVFLILVYVVSPQFRNGTKRISLSLITPA